MLRDWVVAGRLSGIGLKFKARRVFRRFEEAARNLRTTQARVLLEKVRRNQDSRFGREHAFHDIHSVHDFRRRLPVADYTVFEPYVEQVKLGDVRALFGPDERLLMFAVTSGAYSRPKYIPVTTAFLAEHRLGWHVWGHGVAVDHLNAYDYSILRIVSSSRESTTEAGIPCGGISGLMSETLPWPIRRKYVPPVEAASVRHGPSKYYLIGRIALARRISLISTANPSNILALVRAVDRNAEMIVRDLHDGTVDDRWEIPDDLKRRLRGHLRPSRRRARTLEALLTRAGRLLPREYWPELRLLGNWKDGSCGIFLDRYPEYFGDVPVRDVGILASEGRMTIPLTDEGPGGVLDLTSHFFEFIPEEESESDAPTTLLAHELEEDGKYFIVLTTSSGLYRYNISDLVQVTGFFHETPRLRFLNKGHYFSSLTGEKVSEFQVVRSMHEARIPLKFPTEDGIFSPMMDDPPRYSIAVERQPGCSREEWRTFLQRFEDHLCALNVEYAAKRRSGRLGTPVLHLLREGAFDRLKEERLVRMGGRREQYKHCFVIGEIDYHRTLPIEDHVTLDAGPDEPPD